MTVIANHSTSPLRRTPVSASWIGGVWLMAAICMALWPASEAFGEPVPAAIDVNSADAKTLTRLPGVGPVTARRIIEHRGAHGPFKKPDDLLAVRGIGAKTLAKLKPQITFGATVPAVKPTMPVERQGSAKRRAEGRKLFLDLTQQGPTNARSADTTTGDAASGGSADLRRAKPPPAPKRPAFEGVININTAGLSELIRLHGIGPGKARVIIRYREINGPYQAPEEIMKVKGIGKGTFKKIARHITVK